MNIKKFIGDTMPEIMQKIRKELGPDAVILNTKKIKTGGVFGLFAKKKLEVVAALDPEPLARQQNEQKQEINLKQKQPYTTHQQNHSSILQEIHQLKKMLQVQMENDIDIMPQYIFLYDYLREQEVEEDLIESLIQGFHLQIGENEEIASHQLTDSFNQYLTHKLEDYVKKDDHQEKVIHFVGPTGVGKTTTLAKVAANSVLNEGKKVAFITTDTYRIAAIDQLKTYAQILNVPLEVVYTKEDYIQAIEKFTNFDLIYVDTAGRNFRNNSYVEDLQITIEANEQSETYLVLSLTAKPKDINDVFKQFQSLSIKNIIFTKVDETTQFGSILNILLSNDVHVAYLTNGQDVPNDLIKPNARSLTTLLMGDIFHE